MAERRMFAKTIIDSDAFLEMPLSTQALYFHLSMRADDEGFINNPQKIKRIVGASDDDLNLLVAKSFIIPFESGIVVIKHWKIHNYIRGDRLHPTKYEDEKNLLTVKENGAYTVTADICQSNVSQLDGSLDTEVRLGKVSIYPFSNEKGTCLPAKKMPADPPAADIDELSDDETEEDPADAPKAMQVPYQKIVDLYHSCCPSFPRVTVLSEKRKKAIRARWKTYKCLDAFMRLFRKAESSAFLKGSNNRNWSANFDWLISDGNMAKTLDGNYDDPGGRSRDRPKKTAFMERAPSADLDKLELLAQMSDIQDPDARVKYMAAHGYQPGDTPGEWVPLEGGRYHSQLDEKRR